MFACRSVCQDDHSFLRADLDEVCWSSRHLHYALAVGFPMLLFYVVGFPLAAFLKIRGMQHKLTVRRRTFGETEGLSIFEQERKCVVDVHVLIGVWLLTVLLLKCIRTQTKYTACSIRRFDKKCGGGKALLPPEKSPLP